MADLQEELLLLNVKRLNSHMSSASQLMYRRAAEELRAAAFHRSCTLRRFLSALAAHVTKEKLRQWDFQELAEKHSRRSASTMNTHSHFELLTFWFVFLSYQSRWNFP